MLAAPILALAVLAPAHSEPPPWRAVEPADARQDRRSLEDLLREAQLARAQKLQELGPKVAEIVTAMDELRAPVRTPVSEARQKDLLALGPEPAPLLVPYLDPGTDASRSKVFRAELVAEVLAQLDAVAVTDPLLETARSGTPLARANALYVLGHTPEPERVLDPLITIAGGKYDSTVPVEQIGYVREAAYGALARIGTPRASAFVKDTIKGPNLDRARAALTALESAPTESSESTVLAVLESDSAPQLASAILAYYRSHETLLEELEHAQGVSAVAVADSLSVEDRIALFDLLRLNDARVGTPIKRKIDDYTEYARSDVRRAALMLLARMGDRGSQRELQREFDDRIDQSPKSIEAYSDRATLMHAIGEFDDAVRDWREAFDILRENTIRRSRSRGPYIGIARSLARIKRYREARDYLQSAPISLSELQALGQERDFREMRETRYGDIFGDEE